MGQHKVGCTHYGEEPFPKHPTNREGGAHHPVQKKKGGRASPGLKLAGDGTGLKEIHRS